MSISSVSSTSNLFAVSSNSSETSILEKQKLNIEKQIEAVEKSKDDEKTKQKKVQQLQAQLDQINAQIQQSKSQSTIQVSNTSNHTQPSKNVVVNDNNGNSTAKRPNSSDNTLDTYA